jgi:hypothetical protein
MFGYSWVAAQLVASQKGLISMELISYDYLIKYKEDIFCLGVV